MNILVFKAASYFTDGAPVAKIVPKMDHEGIESIRTKYALQQFIRAMTAPPEFFESPLITDRIARGDISLNEIDVSERTHDICLACISRKGCEIRFVPQQLRCALFDRQAVMIDSWAFGYLNCDSKTEELLLDAMRRSLVFDVGMLGEEWAVPVSILTPAVVRQAIQLFGLKRVKEQLDQRGVEINAASL